MRSLLFFARRILVQLLIPLAVCLVPPLVTYFIAYSIPGDALSYYEQHLTQIDRLILSVGMLLFLCQVLLSWFALRRSPKGFIERPYHWLNHLAQAAEWFPLLGLIGTVTGILNTFRGISGRPAAEKIIELYAPAITATGSGLFMALINILPLWMAQTGRGLIELVGGGEAPAAKEVPE